MRTIDPPPPLSGATTLRLGGPPDAWVRAETEAELIEAVRDADARGAPVLLLGGGSNLVVADEGFRGTVIEVGHRGLERSVSGPTARWEVAAGEPWDEVVARAVSAGDAGLECLSGIPGRAGATPVQNVGAYGQEIADTLVSLRAWDRRDGVLRTLSRDECRFEYRDSRFKHAEAGRWVLLSMTLALDPGGSPRVAYAELERAVGGGRATLEAVRDTVLSLRRAKGMVLDTNDSDTVSAGSFFTNPVVDLYVYERVVARAAERGVLREGEAVPRWPAGEGRVKLAAGWLIERAGVRRGEERDGAGVSTKHALALVNRGGSARALVELARSVRGRVRDAFGVELRPEPVFAGFEASDPTAP